jgi:hypothetical protein
VFAFCFCFVVASLQHFKDIYYFSYKQIINNLFLK